MKELGRSPRAVLPLLAMAVILLSFLIPYYGFLPLPPFIRYFVSGFVAAAVLLALLFLPATRIAHLDSAKDTVTAFLARRLRQRGFTATEKGDEMVISLGHLPARTMRW